MKTRQCKPFSHEVQWEHREHYCSVLNRSVFSQAPGYIYIIALCMAAILCHSIIRVSFLSRLFTIFRPHVWHIGIKQSNFNKNRVHIFVACKIVFMWMFLGRGSIVFFRFLKGSMTRKRLRTTTLNSKSDFIPNSCESSGSHLTKAHFKWLVG